MRLGVAVVLILAAPTVLATDVHGGLEVRGGLVLPAGAQLTSVPTALFVPDATTFSVAEGQASLARITLFEVVYATASALDQKPMVGIDHREPTWQLHDVAISLATDNAGWIGLHPEGGTLVERAERELRVEAQPPGSMGNGVADADGDEPGVPYFDAPLDAGHLARETETWSFRGAGTLKLMGPSVTLRARENTTTIQTGEMAEPQSFRTTLRWVVIESDDLSFTGAAAVAQVASPRAVATWEGGATLEGATGSLSDGERSWAAGAPVETLVGSLRATALANRAGDAFEVGIDGDLRQSTMLARAELARPDSGFSLPIAAGVVALVGAAGMAAYYARTRRDDTLGADEYALLADEAADAERYDEAAKWAQRARKRSPLSQRLALDHAYYIAMTGDAARALRMLDDGNLGANPDAWFMKASLLAKARRTPEATAALGRALGLAPALLLDAESDAALRVLLDAPDLRDAAREARRRLR